MSNLNPSYSEGIIQALRTDIDKHLALLLAGGYRYIPDLKEELQISEGGVYYSDFEGIKLSTPQIVVILLEVADFLYKNQDSGNMQIIVTKIVKIPKIYSLFIDVSDSPNPNTDLFGQMPVTHAMYCLSKAFMLLRAKLYERQTGLYHALFLKTCLMLDRENIPPKFLLGEEYSGLTWLNFVKRYLSPNSEPSINQQLELFINIESIDEYPILSGEICKLYLESFAIKRRRKVLEQIVRLFGMDPSGDND